MKTTIIILLTLLAFIAKGQEFHAKSSVGFKTNSGVLTSEKFVVEGRSFDIYVSKKGTKYIPFKSARGTMYPIWVHKETAFAFEGRKVYVSKKGTYCIYKLGVRGNPYPKWLDKK